MKKVSFCLLTIAIAISLAACQNSPQPEDAVKGYFEAAKASDTAKANTFVNPKNVSSEDSSSVSSGDQEEIDLANNLLDYLKSNNKKVTYNITNIDTKDNTATVTADCKFVDGSSILKDAIADYIPKAFAEAFSGGQDPKKTAKEIAELMKDKIKTTKETFTTKTIKINCIRTDGKWYIDKEDDELKNVFASNLISAGHDISKSFGESSSSASANSSSQPVSKFKNNVLTTNDIKIEITKYKIIKPGEKGNDYGEKPVIAFWYKATNISGKDLDPSDAWIWTFKAIQDNDPNSVNELNMGSLPDDKFLDTQDHKIKKGGTVENAMAYELSDTTTPVTLKATEDGEDVGEQTFKLK